MVAGHGRDLMCFLPSLLLLMKLLLAVTKLFPSDPAGRSPVYLDIPIKCASITPFGGSRSPFRFYCLGKSKRRRQAMAARYEVEVTVASARNLKNVNWRHGDLKPYVVAWVDPAAKCSTKVAVDGDDDDPVWDEKLTLPLSPGLPIEGATLALDVVHAGAAEGVKPLVGSARLPLRDVLDEVGLGGMHVRALKLKRPSGRPQGKIEINVAVKEQARYYDPYAPPYGQATSRDYPPSSAGYGYAPPYAAAPSGYPYAQPPMGYPYGSPTGVGYYPYGAPPAVGYGAQAPPPPMGYGQEEKSKSKLGMGAGLAVGAAAGMLGGLALAEGIDYAEDKIADDAAERVEDDLAGDDY
ncbi:hypothetical protein BHE74_00014150 [Ensete ventricosum]|nr:hypothetical protein GW17_00015325 [Ensete ventricosum]RWW77661.1 hypothetical protein BHE74_00014150 [Ensete ventricosum]